MAKKIMAVDDSIFVIEELKHILQGTEYEIVASCRMGEEALELYESIQPDLVLMDIILPGMDGIDTICALQQKWPKVRIIVLSSLALDDVMEQAKTVGACGFIGKPFDRTRILDTLVKALA